MHFRTWKKITLRDSLGGIQYFGIAGNFTCRRVRTERGGSKFVFPDLEIGKIILANYNHSAKSFGTREVAWGAEILKATE